MTRTRSSWVAGVALLVLGSGLGAAVPSPTHGATLSMPSNSAPVGASVDMCVVLSGGQNQIAGIQANILVDARCANAIRGSGNSAECTASAESGKQLTTTIGGPMCGNSPNCVRTLLLAFDNTDPIPDGPLFCCAFTIPDSAPAGDCVFQLSQVRGSTPAGQPILDIGTKPGLLVVSGGRSTGSSGSGGIGGPLAGAAPVAAGGAEPAAPAAPAAGQPAAPAAPAPSSQKAVQPGAGATPVGGVPAAPTAAESAPDVAGAPSGQAPDGEAPGGQAPSAAATAAPAAAPALPPRTAAAGETPGTTPAVTAAAVETAPPGTQSPAAAQAEATPTPPAPTHTPTQPLPTTTPTSAGGWFSGCHIGR